MRARSRRSKRNWCRMRRRSAPNGRRLGEVQTRLPDAQAGRAPAERATQPGHQPDRDAAGLPRTGAQARGPEYRARRRRRRQPVRPRTGADQRHRADVADRRRAERRAGRSGRSCRAASRATSPRWRVSRRRSRRRTRRFASRRRKWNRRAPSWRTRVGISIRRRWSRPCNGTMVNVMLRPGYFVKRRGVQRGHDLRRQRVPGVRALQSERAAQGGGRQRSGDHADTYPGRIVKAHVDSVIWAQAQGQMDASGDSARTTLNAPPGRFPVKLMVAERDKDLFLAAGARGEAAIYTEHFTLIHLVRKVIIRVSSNLGYIIPKSALKGGTMALPRTPRLRRRLRAVASLLAIGLLAATASGCALKAPPDAAAVRQQALPELQVPAEWTARRRGRGRGRPTTGWPVQRRAADGGGDRGAGPQRRSARRRHARRTGAAPCEAGRARNCGRRSICSRGAAASCRATVRAFRAACCPHPGSSTSGAACGPAGRPAPRRRRRRGRLRIRAESIAALVARSWFLATEAGLQIVAARETIGGSEELVRLAGERSRVGVGGEEDVFIARADVAAAATYCASSNWRGPGDSGARAAAWPLSRRRGGAVPAAAGISRRDSGGAAVGAARAAAGRRRRRAARRGRVPPDPGGQGGPPAGHLPDDRCQCDLELAVPSEGSQTIRCGMWAPISSRLCSGGALKTQVEIRTAEQKQAIAEYAVVGMRAFGEVEGALAAEIAARERERSCSGVRRPRAGPEYRPDPVPSGQHRPAIRHAAATRRQRDALRAHPRPGRAAHPTRESAPRARRQLRAAGPHRQRRRLRTSLRRRAEAADGRR